METCRNPVETFSLQPREEAAHLAPFLFVSSKELSYLIHEARVLLLPAESEAALP